MKKTIFTTILLCLTIGSLSAKKKDNVQKTSLDSIVAVAQKDTSGATYILPMISVGEVSFSSDTDESVINEKRSDSVHFKGLDKKQIVDFFVQNVVYPTELKQKAVEDYLKIRFDVDKEGKVKNPKVLNSTYPEMEKEVLRVVGKLPEYSWELPENNTKKRSKQVKLKEEDTTVEVPISFRVLKL